MNIFGVVWNYLFNRPKPMSSNYSIKNKLVFEGKYIVALLDESGANKGRNVVGLDYDGNITWRIPPDVMNSNFRYTSISEKNGQLFVYNFSTNQYNIDYKSGRVLSKRWLK